MILKYQNQMKTGFNRFGIAAVAGVVLVAIDRAMKDAPALLGIFFAALIISAFVAAFIFYSQGVLGMIKAKGYNPFWYVTIILFGVGPVIIFPFLDDASNPTKEAEEDRYTGARCVSCDGRIGSSFKLCPICGWTQPQRELDPIGTTPAAGASAKPA
ncbi:MAG: hypothetical protein JWR26_2460 [Pedosphaera sp.]|nr:hypothetical protein [Pedosphaera sp.]